MSPEAFALGMARMEQLFLGRALTAPERRVYQAALATLTDSRFEVLVQYALTNWRKPGEMPLPGMLRQWAGLSDETPAEREASQISLPEGTPVVGGRPLEEVLGEAEAKGVLSGLPPPDPEYEEAVRLEGPARPGEGFTAYIRRIAQKAQDLKAGKEPA